MSKRGYSVAHQAILDQIEAARNALGLKLDAIVADGAGIRADATVAGDALVRVMAESEVRQTERHVIVMAALGEILERLAEGAASP